MLINLTKPIIFQYLSLVSRNMLPSCHIVSISPKKIYEIVQILPHKNLTVRNFMKSVSNVASMAPTSQCCTVGRPVTDSGMLKGYKLWGFPLEL